MFFPAGPETPTFQMPEGTAGSIDREKLPEQGGTGPAVEVSIVMPCLNEAETLARCIAKAKLGLERAGVAGEVVVADNGSTDGSVEIAGREGARVVPVSERGYGSALRAGIASARGRFVIMGDADDSYDFSEIGGFVAKLREGFDLVMGCRLPAGGGTILPGAMPWKNRWIGNPSLSFVGRLFFKTPIRDFHCGLRGFSKAACERLDLQTTGMEFASEMVIKAAIKRLRVAEVPITLHPDGRSRPPHLRPWRDGWRHLRFMLIYSPRWLFLVPGLVLAAAGVAAGAVLTWGPQRVLGVRLDLGTLIMASVSVLAGVQLVAFACFSKVFGIMEGLLPDDPAFSKWFRVITLERGLVLGLAVFGLGVAVLAREVVFWGQAGFRDLPVDEHLRALVGAATAILAGVQIISASFFLSVLGLKTVRRHAMETGEPAP
jgi:glycosyltransferase involved in cell wall biosynthesis